MQCILCTTGWIYYKIFFIKEFLIANPAVQKYFQITKIENIDTLVNLVWLDLSFNRITKLEGLSSLTKLREAFFVHNKIQKIEGIENVWYFLCISGAYNRKKLHIWNKLIGQTRTINTQSWVNKHIQILLSRLHTLNFFFLFTVLCLVNWFEMVQK